LPLLQQFTTEKDKKIIKLEFYFKKSFQDLKTYVPSSLLAHHHLFLNPVTPELNPSNFLALLSSELRGYITPLTTFLVNKECSLHKPVLIFKPTVNSSTGYKQH